MTISSRHSFCRACMNSCPMIVEITDGRLTAATGDPSNPIFDGYSCVKGRAQPTLYDHPDRLLHSLKREADGSYVPIAVETAMDEVAERLAGIVAANGPRAFACYVGTSASGNYLIDPFFNALLQAVGSKMKFAPNTIDKPGKSLALAMHGRWGAPLQGYQDPDVALVLGANPFKSYYGTACGHPGKWLGEQLDRGMDLLVVDPRRTDLAKRAALHVQPRPGHDPAILACMINVILGEDLWDHEFVEPNARGIDALALAVSPFTPELVALAAGVEPEDLTSLARRFAAARRGYAVCGVGPGFSKSSTLLEYLILVLETLCGHWLREGERVARTTTLIPSGPYRAQADDPTPAYGFGEVLRVGGLVQTTAGMPTGALADEILLEGEGQVRALFSVGGNPVLAWPDQLKTIDALESIDLLVQFDPWMSATARMADYVIAPTMPYETPGMTVLTDFIIALPTYYGPAEAYAHYTDAVVEPPDGSEVIPEWMFIHGVAKRMGLTLSIRGKSLTPAVIGEGIPVDPDAAPDAEALLEQLAAGGRVSLEEVKRHPSGAPFPEPAQFVEAREPGWPGRFDLANEDMIADLAREHPAEVGPDHLDEDAPFRLISIREQHIFNSTVNLEVTHRGRPYNPAYLHPDDLADLGLEAGDVVEIISSRATIRGVLQPDGNLRPGLVAMAYGYGDGPHRDDQFREIGSSPGRLLDGSILADPYVGMPRMGDVPVRIRALGC